MKNTLMILVSTLLFTAFNSFAQESGKSKSSTKNYEKRFFNIKDCKVQKKASMCYKVN
jgi:ABC-type transporter MlaC component